MMFNWGSGIIIVTLVTILAACAGDGFRDVRRPPGEVEQAERPPTAAQSPEVLRREAEQRSRVVEPSRPERYIATRSFTGPHDIPPDDKLSAYGIVAFNTYPIEEERQRHLRVCRSYISTLPSSMELPDESRVKKMTTYWPLKEDKFQSISEMNAASSNLLLHECNNIVEHYHLATAQVAVNQADRLGATMKRERGPFLLAWAPPKSKGDSNANVLAMDLSSCETQSEFSSAFLHWRSEIENNPQLWGSRRGWTLEEVRSTIGEFADKYGSGILMAIGFAEEVDLDKSVNRPLSGRCAYLVER